MCDIIDDLMFWKSVKEPFYGHDAYNQKHPACSHKDIAVTKIPTFFSLISNYVTN